MPLLNYRMLILFRKFLRFRQFPNFQTVRLAQLNLRFHNEYGFTTAAANMDMNRAMFVAVKREFVSVLLKNFRHRPESYQNDGPISNHA
jgi:hypothetical protein